ncbi:LysR substrate-binding domain-containing protein [Roseovarius aestuarii]|nr:LysR substrate-binding domain-containing protein [Roseovarius aestuarii]
MNLRQLKYFIALAEELHFGRAAAILNIAQPPLSQQIKALEADLDVSLFDRSTRPIALTPAGLALLREGREIVSQVARAEAIARREGSKDAGRLVIGVTGTAALEFAAPVLKALSRRRPNVQVSLREMSSPAQLEALEKGDIHIGFVRPPVLDERMSIRLVHSEQFYVALPHDHPKAREKEVRLAELSGTPLVIFERDEAPGFRDLMLHVCRTAGYTPTTIQDAPQMVTMLCLVAAGLGCAMVPASARRLAINDVSFRPLVDYSPSIELYAVWMPEKQAPFVDDLLQAVSEAQEDNS